jgi:kumamolisin
MRVPQELAARYGFPVITQKSRFWVAILEFGGGYLESDMTSYCTQQRIDVPEIASITLPGGDGEFNEGNKANLEYALDMQNVAGATHGLVNLLLVNAPNNLAAFADGLKAIANWDPPGDGKVSAVSLSWGADENVWEKYAPESIDPTEAALKVCEHALCTLLHRAVPAEMFPDSYTVCLT